MFPLKGFLLPKSLKERGVRAVAGENHTHTHTENSIIMVNNSQPYGTDTSASLQARIPYLQSRPHTKKFGSKAQLLLSRREENGTGRDGGKLDNISTRVHTHTVLSRGSERRGLTAEGSECFTSCQGQGQAGVVPSSGKGRKVSQQ